MGNVEEGERWRSRGEPKVAREKRRGAVMRRRQPPDLNNELPPRHWPRLMRAQTAAEYTDEKSVQSFLRRTGSIYPSALQIPGRGRVWTKESLDEAIDRLTRARSETSGSLADDL